MGQNIAYYQTCNDLTYHYSFSNHCPRNVVKIRVYHENADIHARKQSYDVPSEKQACPGVGT